MRADRLSQNEAGHRLYAHGVDAAGEAALRRMIVEGDVGAADAGAEAFHGADRKRGRRETCVLEPGLCGCARVDACCRRQRRGQGFEYPLVAVET